VAAILRLPVATASWIPAKNAMTETLTMEMDVHANANANIHTFLMATAIVSSPNHDAATDNGSRSMVRSVMVPSTAPDIANAVRHMWPRVTGIAFDLSTDAVMVNGILTRVSNVTVGIRTRLYMAAHLAASAHMDGSRLDMVTALGTIIPLHILVISNAILRIRISLDLIRTGLELIIPTMRSNHDWPCVHFDG